MNTANLKRVKHLSGIVFKNVCKRQYTIETCTPLDVKQCAYVTQQIKQSMHNTTDTTQHQARENNMSTATRTYVPVDVNEQRVGMQLCYA